MKNNTNNIAKTGMLVRFLAMTALCMGQSDASAKPPHGGGSGGGLPYPTASTVSQLIADINYASKTGGAITINLAPGSTFKLNSADNSVDGGNGLPVVGGATALNLTILGNGDAIERVAVVNRWGMIKNFFRLLDVAAGSSLTLDKVALTGGASYNYDSGGGILNYGTLNVVNGSSISGNNSIGIYNAGGSVTLSDSTVSGNGAGAGGGIYNDGGTVTVSGSVVSGNYAEFGGGGIFNNGGKVTASNSTLSNNRDGVNGDVSGTYGGAIYNSGGSVSIASSLISSNYSEYGGAIYNDGGILSISNYSLLSSNTAFFFFYDGSGGIGGAIYSSGGSVSIDNTSVTNNTADLLGGGIFIDADATLTMSNSSVSRNSVTGNNYFEAGDGGGILNGGTAIVIDSTHIFGNSPDDVENSGELDLDGSSTIDTLEGNPANPFP